jgi:ribosome-interacting GTPase 1
MSGIDVKKYYKIELTQEDIESIIKSYILNNTEVHAVTDISFSGLSDDRWSHDADSRTKLSATITGV